MGRLIRFLLPYGLLLLLLWGVVSLPDPVRLDGATIIPSYGLQSLPDAPITAMAEEEWAASRYDIALVLLAGVVERGEVQPDGQAKLLLERYLQALAVLPAPSLHRLGAIGKEPGLLGNNFTRLAQRRVSDAFSLDAPPQAQDTKPASTFASGDIERELADIGLVPALFPQGKAAAALVSALEQAGAFSPSLQQSLQQQAASLRVLPDVQRMQGLRQILSPFWELAQQSHSFATVTVMVKVCDDVQQVRIVGALAGLSSGNSAKLAQVLAVASLGNTRLAQEVMAHVMQHGQQGLETLHALFIKGPEGMAFGVRNPEVARLLVSMPAPQHELLPDAILARWTAVALDSPRTAQLIKLGLLGGCLFCVLVVMGFQLRSSAFLQAHGHGHGKQLTSILLGCGLLMLLALLAFGAFAPTKGTGDIPIPQAPSASISGQPARGSAAGSEGLESASPWKWGLILMTLVFAAAVQYWLFTVARAKVRDIMTEPKPPRQKLYLLENLDLYFDLPMYVGLGFTILSFLLITISGADSARYVAYLTTLFGICNAVCMRVSLQQPARSALFDGDQPQASGD